MEDGGKMTFTYKPDALHADKIARQKLAFSKKHAARLAFIKTLTPEIQAYYTETVKVKTGITHTWTKKRESRADRPRLKDYMEMRISEYKRDMGIDPKSTIKKLWKQQYRKLYSVKDDTRPIHNLTRLPHIQSVKKFKPENKPKQKQGHGAGVDSDTYRNSYLNKWRRYEIEDEKTKIQNLQRKTKTDSVIHDQGIKE